MSTAITNDGRYIVTARADLVLGQFKPSTSPNAQQRGTQTKVDARIELSVAENDGGKPGQMLIPSLPLLLMSAISTNNPVPSTFHVGVDNDTRPAANRRAGIKLSDSIWEASKKAIGEAINEATSEYVKTGGMAATRNSVLSYDASMLVEAAKIAAEKRKEISATLPQATSTPVQKPEIAAALEKAISGSK